MIYHYLVNNHWDTQLYLMAWTVIFKVIGIGYNPYRADLGYGYKRAIFSRFWSKTLFSNKISNGDGHEIHM